MSTRKAPYWLSTPALALVAAGVALAALVVAVLAIRKTERAHGRVDYLQERVVRLDGRTDTALNHVMMHEILMPDSEREKVDAMLGMKGPDTGDRRHGLHLVGATGGTP